MNIARPWDCEAFPKSKTICYGGGGGGGGSIGDNPLVEKVAKETGYTGSDLDKTAQHTETMAKQVLNYEGSTTSPDPTGALTPTDPPQTPGPATGDTPNPTIAAGDIPGDPTAPLEELLVGATERNPQMMSGRRKTMLTVGQNAAKIKARQTGY